jgi:hypothetical protein
MMRKSLSIPEIGLIAATRAAAGAGVGLLLADRLGREQRRAVGWTLLGIGALTTIPILVQLLSHEQPKLQAFRAIGSRA